MSHEKIKDVTQKIDDYCKIGDESIIDGVAYSDLFCIYDVLGANQYKHILQKYFNHAEQALDKCKRIKVGFIFSVPYTWAFDSLYFYAKY